MPTVSEVCKDFAKTTTISGVYFIAKYKSCTVKLLWVFITFALIVINIYQSYLCTCRFLSHPTKVITILSHGALTFPAVTFCSTNPYVSDRLTESTGAQLKQTQDSLKEQLYGAKKSSARKKRASQACYTNWEQVDQSCYYFPNKTGNWTDAVSYCGGLNSTLPIFRNITDLFNFRDWWDNKTINGQTWLGLKYDADVKRWNWLNNCSYMHFPDFWHDYWNWNYIKTSSAFFAKFSTKLWLNSLTMKGAEPTVGTDSTLQIVCFKETYDINQPCLSFEQTKPANDFLCSSGWWCANDNALGQSVASAVNSDSCFCINHEQLSFKSAADACKSFGGFLSDIRTVEELNLILQLANSVFNNDPILASFCPAGFVYFNQSCFWYSGNKTSTVSSSVANEAACQAINSSHAASIHSFYELWFVNYLMMSDSIAIDWMQWWTFGTYIGGYRTSCSSLWQWTDGTPNDYPIVSKQFPFVFWPYAGRQPDCELSIGLSRDSGLLSDFTVQCPFTCRKFITVFPLWINYMSNYSYLDCNATCISDVTTQPVLFYFKINKSGDFASENATNNNTNLSLCRKDRNANSSDTFCTSKPFCFSTTSTTATSTVEPTSTVATTTTTTTSTPASPTVDRITSSFTSFQSTSFSNKSNNPSTTSTQAFIGQTIPKQIAEVNGLSALSVAQEKMLYESREMNEDDLSKLSYTLNELLSICTYNGTSCDSKKFKKSYYSNVGNCYSFNILNNPLNVQSEAGANFGLSLTLKINISTYLFTSLSPGFLFVVHEQNETIFPDSQSIKVVAGYRVDISVVMIQTSIQPWPYSNCVDNTKQSSYNYSVEYCQRSCQQNQVTDRCGCADPALPPKINFKFCKYIQKTCVDMAKANTDSMNCDCPPTCRMKKKPRKKPILSSENAAFIRIFYKQLSYITYMQDSAYDIITYISDLSNWLGLYLGFSALTIFELIPFLYSLQTALSQTDN